MRTVRRTAVQALSLGAAVTAAGVVAAAPAFAASVDGRPAIPHSSRSSVALASFATSPAGRDGGPHRHRTTVSPAGGTSGNGEGDPSLEPIGSIREDMTAAKVDATATAGSTRRLVTSSTRRARAAAAPAGVSDSVVARVAERAALDRLARTLSHDLHLSIPAARDVVAAGIVRHVDYDRLAETAATPVAPAQSRRTGEAAARARAARQRTAHLGSAS